MSHTPAAAVLRPTTDTAQPHHAHENEEMK